MAELAKGQILRLSVDSDKYENARFGGTDLVDVSATWNEETGRVALFFANRGLEEAADVEVALRGFDARQVLRAEVLEIPEGGTVSRSIPKAVRTRWGSSRWKARRRAAPNSG